MTNDYRTTVDSDGLRFKISLLTDKGFDPDQAANLATRLRGETPEELRADADLLAETFAAPKTPRVMATDPSQASTGPVSTGTPSEQFLAAFGNYRVGSEWR